MPRPFLTFALDRARVAARQAAAELGKEKKARAADHEAARATQAAANREAVAAWTREQQEMRVELATLGSAPRGQSSVQGIWASGCCARESRRSAIWPGCAKSRRR